ncbi:MAG: SBBP repeat-containing protein, partial [Candidatus Auribacterota bacterium]|nr:SBBP repeat-containing protein [Candidatus Auribacterota bacterium]
MKKYLICVPALFFLAAIISPLSGQVLKLEYSTYLGGHGEDEGKGIAVDSAGRAYVIGITGSLDFPTISSYQAEFAGGVEHNADAFVSKFSTTGSALIYSTYLGGSGDDAGLSIAVNSAGFALVAGVTMSSDFPTINSCQGGFAGEVDVFAAKFSSSGSKLLYSTYLGGSNRDGLTPDGELSLDLVLGSEDVVYLAGVTNSSNFPTRLPFQAANAGGEDLFVSVLDLSESGDPSFLYSSYFGGSSLDEGVGIAVDSEGCVYLAGTTRSLDLPTLTPYQAGFAGGTGDAFLSKFSSSGDALIYSTYLGGSGNDAIEYGEIDDALIPLISVAVDESGCAYLTGITDSPDFPTWNPYQAGKGSPQGNDAFVSKFSSSGTSLLYSTYLGGSYFDAGASIAVDSVSRAYVTGSTDSLNFPIVKPFQRFPGGGIDAFAIKFSSTGSRLIFSTYLGGSHEDEGQDIALGEDQRIYLAGTTSSSDYPTRNPYQAAWNEATDGEGERLWDAFVSRLYFQPRNKIMTDFNGDGTSDIAIFRGASGLWAVRGVTRVYFGGSTDETVPGDYDGDGTTDIGVFRPASGLWAIRSVTRAYFGSGSDLPESGDYDGDGTADIGIFRAASGLWAIRGVTRAYFGSSTDEPVPGYYDADGSQDIGIFRPGSGLWAIRGITRAYFGGST